MKTRLALCLCIILSLGSLLTGCSKKDDTQSSSGSKGKEKVFVMIPKGVHPYYEPCYEGFKDAGAKLGVKTEYLAAKAFEVPQEVEIIENVIARHVDGIAIPGSASSGQKVAPRGKAAVRARASRRSVFQNLQRESLVHLHPGGAQQRAHRFRGAALPPDHLPQIFRMYAQLQNRHLRTLD